MKSTRVYLIVILSLALFTVTSFAWRWHLQLTSLQNGGTAKNPKDMTAIEKRVWDAEQRARQLEADLANAKAALEAAQGRGGNAAQAANAGGRGQNAANPLQALAGRGAQQALQQVLNRPEYQQAAAIQQKAQIDAQYAALVRNLGLPAEQADKVKSLIFDRDTAMQDAVAAAQSARLNPQTPEYQQFLDQAMSQYNDNLRGTLGETGYTSLQNYEATQNQRAVVNTFQQQLLQYGTAALLTDTQSEELTQLLANSRGARGGAQPAAGFDQVFAFGGRGGGGANVLAQTFIGAAGAGAIAGAQMQQISPNVLAQAQTILSPVQYTALQNMQKAQQAQATMMQITTSAVRDATQQDQQGTQQRGGRGGTTQPAAGGGRTRGQ